MGRPSIYGTTSEFLDVFNLPDLNALPPEYELDSIIESKKVDITQISEVRNASKENFIFDDVDELEELASKIRSIATTTTFTSDLKSNKNTEDGVRKNAFELLESHIDKNLINTSMQSASESEPLGIPDEIKVMQDLLYSLGNEPIDEDDFEMIDLDTGEAIIEETLEELELNELTEKESLVEEREEKSDLSVSEEIDTESNGKLDEIIAENNEEIEGIVLDAQSLFEEEESPELEDLESALDAAFDKFKNAQKNLAPDTELDDSSIDELINSHNPNEIDSLDDLLKDD